MKKLISFLLAAAMLLSLCACGSSTPKKPIEEMDDADWEAAAEILEEEYAEEPAPQTEPVQKIYQIGETIVTADGSWSSLWIASALRILAILEDMCLLILNRKHGCLKKVKLRLKRHICSIQVQ